MILFHYYQKGHISHPPNNLAFTKGEVLLLRLGHGQYIFISSFIRFWEVSISARVIDG